MEDKYLKTSLEWKNVLKTGLEKYINPIEQVKSKYKYEFIELCNELEPIYGKQIWGLVRRVGYTEYKIRKAHEIAKKNGKVNIGYLIGIIKKL